ncbi:unnamed protein product, partial [Didymodactylos carnosus]
MNDDYNNNNIVIVLIHKKDAQIDDISQRLHCITQSFIKFNNIDDTLAYIDTIKDKKLILIIYEHDLFMNYILPAVHHIQMIIFIYIHSSSSLSKANFSWFQTKKVRIKCSDNNELLEKLNHDLVRITDSISINELSLLNSDKSSTDLELDQNYYIWDQLKMKVLLDVKHDNDLGKEELLKAVRVHYQNNPAELSIIDEFERDYEPHDAIKWYTRACFLYRLLNKVLRERNINELLKFRLIIVDLHRQLSLLYQVSTVDARVVYRGQRLALSKLKQFKVGTRLCMNTFLSTTDDKDVALLFCGRGTDSNPLYTSALYKIQIPNQNSTVTPFANIKYHSYFRNENEILFSINAVEDG